MDKNTARERFKQIERMYDADIEFTQFYSCPPDLALSYNYVVVGSWDGWSAFHDLRNDQRGTTKLRTSVRVPAGQSVEFQILRDGDWNQRIFPYNGATGSVLGPSPDGHGKNWRLDAPSHQSSLTIEWDASTGRMDCIIGQPNFVASAKTAPASQLHREVALSRVPRRARSERASFRTLGARRAFHAHLLQSSMRHAMSHGSFAAGVLTSACLMIRRLRNRRLF